MFVKIYLLENGERAGAQAEEGAEGEEERECQADSPLSIESYKGLDSGTRRSRHDPKLSWTLNQPSHPHAPRKTIFKRMY